MPVYLFTFHAHGPEESSDVRPQPSQPNRETPRKTLRAADHAFATETPHGTEFDPDHQRKLIDSLIDSQRPLRFRCFGVAADASQFHVLVAWNDHRDPLSISQRVARSLATAMNREFGRREWFAEDAAQKRVRNRTQFDYLMQQFLPRHSGELWTYQAGFRTAWRSG